MKNTDNIAKHKHLEEAKDLISSLFESIQDEPDIIVIQKKLHRCIKDMEHLTKSSPLSKNKDANGHTKYLQGIHLPIVINSIQTGSEWKPSEVTEMHIGTYNDEPALILTPKIISID